MHTVEVAIGQVFLLLPAGCPSARPQHPSPPQMVPKSCSEKGVFALDHVGVGNLVAPQIWEFVHVSEAAGTQRVNLHKWHPGKQSFSSATFSFSASQICPAKEGNHEEGKWEHKQEIQGRLVVKAPIQTGHWWRHSEQCQWGMCVADIWCECASVDHDTASLIQSQWCVIKVSL